MSLSFTSYIVALGYQSGFNYVTAIIVLEQNDHYNKMQKNITNLNHAVSVLQDDINNLQQKRLTQDDKKLLKKSLRDLEEIGLNISRETGFYQEDTTVHFFFEPKGEIVEYFNRTRNTSLYIDRLVRAVEQGLFEKNMNKEQKEIIMNNYESLTVEIKSINNR